VFRVVDEDGRELGRDRDLVALRRKLAPEVQRTLSAAATGLEQRDLEAYPAGGVPHEVTTAVGDHDVTGYPALVERGDAVDLVVLPTAREQQAAMPAGVRRLLLREVPSPVKSVVAGLSTQQKLALGHTPYASVPVMLADVVAASVDALLAEAGVPWDRAAYDAALTHVRAGLPEEVDRAVRTLADLLAAAFEVRSALEPMTGKPLAPLVSHVRAQLDGLVPDGFVGEGGVRRLPDLLRYLRAMALRLERAPRDLARDAVRAGEVAAVQQAVDAARASHPGPEADELRWMVEELRVSLFAQGIRTAHPVSSTRILKAIAALDR
jgi:ATP-dependent helicase HrpA